VLSKAGSPGDNLSAGKGRLLLEAFAEIANIDDLPVVHS